MAISEVRELFRGLDTDVPVFLIQLHNIGI